MKPNARRLRAALRPAGACLLASLLLSAADAPKRPTETPEAKKAKQTKAMSFAQPGSVIKGFSAPHFNADGQIIGRIHSERAVVLGDGKYRVEGILVQGFKDGRPDYDLTLGSCIYSLDTGLVTSDEVVRISRTNVFITGQGAVWDVANFHGRLLSNVVMVVRDIDKGAVQKVMEQKGLFQ